MADRMTMGTALWLVAAILPLFFQYFHVSLAVPVQEPYDRNLLLDPEENYHLFWKVQPTTKSIVFEIQVRTRGWAGLGFSPNGGMSGADIVIVWIDSAGTPQISDRHAPANGLPLVDSHQDYELIKAVKNDTHLIASFSRKLVTCDPEDWPITDDTVKLIWAYDDEVPRSPTDIKKHASIHRSSRSAFLTLTPLTQTQWEEQRRRENSSIQTLEFRTTDVPVPNDIRTTYWCQCFALPPRREKLHLIRFEPAIQKGNERVVHHITLFSCAEDMSHFVNTPGSCFRPNGRTLTQMFERCSGKRLAIWAIGGEGHSLPSDVGYPMFETDEERYVMMQIHYENAQLESNIRDSSGMRLYLTNRLRPIESGMLSFGVPAKPTSLAIPPRQKQFTAYTYCNADCTKHLPAGGINVFGVQLHAHLAGIKVRLRHLRNGEELVPIGEDNHYDFNYQDLRSIRNIIKVMPNDEFVLECVYDTFARNETTFGGASTKEEMCQALIEYYPRGDVFSCMSWPDANAIYKIFGMKQMNDYIQYVVDSNGREVTYETLKQRIDSTQEDPVKLMEVAQKLQSAHRDSNHTIFCKRTNTDLKKGAAPSRTQRFDYDTGTGEAVITELLNQEGYPKIRKPYSSPDLCATNGRR